MIKTKAHLIHALKQWDYGFIFGLFITFIMSVI